ncbi:MAG: hypothetical protein V3U35_05130, partial [Candidatus Neomarinimicrobiota bacterium]
MAVGAGALLVAAGCDFQLLEPLAIPKWDVSLTMPLFSETYRLESLAENDTTISRDTTTNEIQIEFTDDLEKTEIDSSLLEIELPAEATTQSIEQTVDGIDASDLFSPVEESIQVVIALDSLLRAAPLPIFDSITFPSLLPVIIPDSIWNTHLASQAFDESQGP